MAFFSRPTSSNAAVRIVQPTDHDDSEKSKPQMKKDSIQRQCRNILIYGSCRFQDKGCLYYHPPVSEELSAAQRSESPMPGALTAQAVNAPVFVPKAGINAFSPPSTPTIQPAIASPSPTSPPNANYQDNGEYDSYSFQPSDGTLAMDDLAGQMQGLDAQLYGESPDEQSYYQSDYEDHMMSMSGFYPPSQSTFVRQPLNYHLYTHPIPDTFSPSYFISDNIREELQQRSETIRTAPAPGLNLPEELQGYHTLVPLESLSGERRKFFSWYSTVYRAIGSADGAPYTLRRVENFRLMHQTAFNAIEMWARVRHPNIVRVKEAFTTRSFADNSLIVAYDYHANAKTLYDEHIKPKVPTFQNGRLQAQTTVIPERVLWSYIIQLSGAISVIHDAGLAARMIDATKVLVTGKNRLRISSCGIVDVLMHDARQDVGMLQQEDLVMFGRLLFALCCNNLAAMNTLSKAVETLTRGYSSDIKNVALYLISKPGPHKTISQLIDMIGKNRLMAEMDEVQGSADRLESELTSELENGRLVRLLCKFGFINERPEFPRQPRWSETGDRYIIKLFRDYVFHQVDENGNPVVNLSHVLTCLNKLDCGTEERIMLVSRDEQSCLVVSYKEVKSCIEGAFSDLARPSR